MDIDYLLSVRCKDIIVHLIQEALRRGRSKSPGRQKLNIPKNWGFANVDREEYLQLKEGKRVLQYIGVTFILWR